MFPITNPYNINLPEELEEQEDGLVVMPNLLVLEIAGALRLLINEVEHNPENALRMLRDVEDVLSDDAIDILFSEQVDQLVADLAAEEEKDEEDAKIMGLMDELIGVILTLSSIKDSENQNGTEEDIRCGCCH